MRLKQATWLFLTHNTQIYTLGSHISHIIFTWTAMKYTVTLILPHTQTVPLTNTFNPVSQTGLEKQHACRFMKTQSMNLRGSKSNKYAHLCNWCRVIGTSRPQEYVTSPIRPCQILPYASFVFKTGSPPEGFQMASCSCSILFSMTKPSIYCLCSVWQTISSSAEKTFLLSFALSPQSVNVFGC